MHAHDATELAYKNGYEQGLKDAEKKNPMQLTIEDIANIISQCEAKNVVFNVQFFPMKKVNEATNNEV